MSSFQEIMGCTTGRDNQSSSWSRRLPRLESVATTAVPGRLRPLGLLQRLIRMYSARGANKPWTLSCLPRLGFMEVAGGCKARGVQLFRHGARKKHLHQSHGQDCNRHKSPTHRSWQDNKGNSSCCSNSCSSSSSSSTVSSSRTIGRTRRYRPHPDLKSGQIKHQCRSHVSVGPRSEHTAGGRLSRIRRKNFRFPNMTTPECLMSEQRRLRMSQQPQRSGRENRNEESHQRPDCRCSTSGSCQSLMMSALPRK
mmetsp:Transcript_80909/g.160353  ORF Transcript_80909/g.160353 Transcript_80909/m.160353 type:complete len:253 (-) Transcript_80909:772-1530(-)